MSSVSFENAGLPAVSSAAFSLVPSRRAAASSSQVVTSTAMSFCSMCPIVAGLTDARSAPTPRENHQGQQFHGVQEMKGTILASCHK